jgi:hypothetical protein
MMATHLLREDLYREDVAVIAGDIGQDEVVGADDTAH